MVLVTFWESLTLQINHHHLLLVLEFAQVLCFFLLLCQLRGHLTNSVIQQLFFLSGTINTGWTRLVLYRSCYKVQQLN